MQRLTTQNEDDEVDTSAGEAMKASVPFDIKPALFSSLRSPKQMWQSWEQETERCCFENSHILKMDREWEQRVESSWYVKLGHKECKDFCYFHVLTDTACVLSFSKALSLWDCPD